MGRSQMLMLRRGAASAALTLCSIAIAVAEVHLLAPDHQGGSELHGVAKKNEHHLNVVNAPQRLGVSSVAAKEQHTRHNQLVESTEHGYPLNNQASPGEDIS